MTPPSAPAWIGDGIVFIHSIKSNVRIRTLRLTEQQWTEYEAYIQQTPRTLWGYPVEKRPRRPNPMPMTPPDGFAVTEKADGDRIIPIKR
jgi:hypothetical protein